MDIGMIYIFFLNSEVTASRIFLLSTSIIWIKRKFCFLHSPRDLELRIQTINEASSMLWYSTSLLFFPHPTIALFSPLKNIYIYFPWVCNFSIQSPLRLLVLRDRPVLRAWGRKLWLVTRLGKPSPILFTRIGANPPNVLSTHVLFRVTLPAQRRLNSQPPYLQCCEETHLHSTDSAGVKGSHLPLI